MPTKRLLALTNTRGKNEKNRTKRDLELKRELNWLTDLNYAIHGSIVQKALEMEDENGWKRLEKNLLARLARVGLADLNELGLRDACECFLNCVYRIGLPKRFEG